MIGVETAGSSPLRAWLCLPFAWLFLLLSLPNSLTCVVVPLLEGSE